MACLSVSLSWYPCLLYSFERRTQTLFCSIRPSDGVVQRFGALLSLSPSQTQRQRRRDVRGGGGRPTRSLPPTDGKKILSSWPPKGARFSTLTLSFPGTRAKSVSAKCQPTTAGNRKTFLKVFRIAPNHFQGAIKRRGSSMVVAK